MPGPATAASAAATKNIPSFLPKIFHGWVGSGRIFPFLASYERYGPIGFLNSIYNVAPLYKWSLSIVPLYGIFSGNPPVEKLDFNSSAALTATGAIWFVYALIIQPQNSGSRSLALVNMCLGTVNGYNCYRSYKYQQSQKAKIL